MARQMRPAPVLRRREAAANRSGNLGVVREIKAARPGRDVQVALLAACHSLVRLGGQAAEHKDVLLIEYGLPATTVRWLGSGERGMCDAIGGRWIERRGPRGSRFCDATEILRGHFVMLL